MTDQRPEAAERRSLVAAARHSGEMEGSYMSPQGEADAAEYIAGVIGSDDLVQRARARYGLV